VAAAHGAQYDGSSCCSQLLAALVLPSFLLDRRFRAPSTLTVYM
jgi:hypothetical protein